MHTTLSKNCICAINFVSAGTRTSSKSENSEVFLCVGVYVCIDVLCCTYSKQHKQLNLSNSEVALRSCYLEAVVFEPFSSCFRSTCTETPHKILVQLEILAYFFFLLRQIVSLKYSSFDFFQAATERSSSS